MGWSIGFDSNWNRDIGYGVPAVCDHPKCNEAIDRGLGYVCGGDPYGGEHGCGLFFCGQHLYMGKRQRCKRCSTYKPAYKPKPDVAEWMRWKLRDMSWKQWRDENPEEVMQLRLALRAARTSVTSPAAQMNPEALCK